MFEVRSRQKGEDIQICIAMYGAVAELLPSLIKIGGAGAELRPNSITVCKPYYL